MRIKFRFMGTFMLLVFAGVAVAVPVIPANTVQLTGTTLAARPELGGLTLHDELIPFDVFDSGGALLYRGVLQNTVVRSDIDGTLDFYYRIRDTQPGHNGILDALSITGFLGWNTDIDFRLDGDGTTGPSSGSRSAGGDVIDFSFGAPVFSGSDSLLMFVKTNATRFADGGYTTLGLTTGEFVVRDTVVPISEPTLLDTDLTTYAEFQNCFTGPNDQLTATPRPVPPGCRAAFDINSDLLIDLIDARSVLFPPLCSPRWAKDLFPSGVLDGQVYALKVFDCGIGGFPCLYVGGKFTTAGGVPADHIARWDGSTWSAVGSGLSGDVYALTVYDDGAGPALYAGGRFSFSPGGDIPRVERVAKWDGSSWSAVGSGLNQAVFALAVYNDGAGDALYAGGGFAFAGSTATDHIAKWNGSSWSALGPGLDNSVHALAVFDDGTGRALYAGGRFNNADATSVDYIAKWNGSLWSAVGSALDDEVLALTVFNDGTGNALFAGGGFTRAGGIPANHIAKWNGSSWSALGTGLAGLPDPNFEKVFALTVFHDGRRRSLYAGGVFTIAGGIPANYIARWNGSSWRALGSGLGYGPFALSGFDDGTGPALYAGGAFATAGGSVSYLMAKWYRPYWPCP